MSTRLKTLIFGAAIVAIGFFGIDLPQDGGFPWKHVVSLFGAICCFCACAFSWEEGDTPW